MAKTLIRVGHPAYNGANAMRMCFSKAQAVRVLRNRGLKRDDARKAVNEALASGGKSVWSDERKFECIEIVNEDFGLRNGYFMRSYEEMRDLWAKASEH